MYDLRVSVAEVRGFCDLPMKVGDYFEVSGGRIYLPPSGYICMWALAALLPMLPAKQREIKEENDWIPTTEHMSCPDPNGMVIYRSERLPGVAPLRLDPTSEPLHAAQGSTTPTLPPRRMLVRGEDCDACGECVRKCAEIHEVSRIFPRSPGEAPGICRQCGNAPCVRACPRGALVRDPDTGAVLLREDLCSSCSACADACPFGAIGWHPRTGLPVICDLCGGEPACVSACPNEAIRFGRAFETR